MNLTIELKNEIYDYIYSNRNIIIYKRSEFDKINMINSLLEKYNISFNNYNEFYAYLTSHWDKKCKNDTCDNERKMIVYLPNRISYETCKKTYGIFKYCSQECNYSSISKRQMGENNTSHRMSEETFKMMCVKNSIKMKENIKNGNFIPPITNSWAKSRCDISFIRNGEIVNIKTRSTWEAYFQIFNTNLYYEKVIIPYKYKNENYNYIVDFVDYENKILYEIKPDSNIYDEKVVEKTKYAKRWCKKNGYKFLIISNKWFYKNYNEELVIGQKDEEKIIRNLKQFNENKKYKKNRL